MGGVLLKTSVIATSLLASTMIVGCSSGQPVEPLAVGAIGTTSGRTSPTPPPISAATFSPLATYPAGSPFNEPPFPIAVWFESVGTQADVDLDAAAGLNTYLLLTTDSDVDLATDTGMRLIKQSQWLEVDDSPAQGWAIADEIDMIEANAEGAVRGRAQLGKELAALPQDGTPRYVNFGKGVVFWLKDRDAAAYVNYPGLDIVSGDVYWFTDDDACGQWQGGGLFLEGARVLTVEECQRAANYGATVRRVRELDERDRDIKPVWGLVEVGHPGGSDRTVTPDQVRAGVWQAVIAGAQGIVYFNHSFEGPCPTQHALRDPCYAATREMVTAVNAQLTELSGVLAQPTVHGFARAAGLHLLTKKSARAWYIFAGSDGSSGTRSIAIAEGSRVEVVGEDRTVPVAGGMFTDRFADPNAVHIYRITT